jgi:uncharacterized membrane protein YeaQ/YmgE (transglycosylase-associated protein family)
MASNAHGPERGCRQPSLTMSVFVWLMVGIALWHFAILVPDRFYGGIIGAFVAGAAGGVLSGMLLPVPGIPADNPPGIDEALWAIPGALVGLALSYAYGGRREGAGSDG